VGILVFVWDAPNMNSAQEELIGPRPGAVHADMSKLMEWLVERAGDNVLNACLFFNVRGEPSPKYHSWLRFLSSRGFDLFLKPKRTDDSDVDSDMLRYIEERVACGDVVEVVVASHDARCFEEPMKRWAQQGMRVTLVGFAELANGWRDFEDVIFVDLESIPGLFGETLKRHINLWRLPDEGELFKSTSDPASYRRAPAARTRPPRATLKRGSAKIATDQEG
jgi:putative heme uptake system protein